MIAVVIPYYKKAFFSQTLNSLKEQTDKRFRLYIGDDASAESPNEIIAGINESLNFEYHRFDKNFGKESLVGHWKRCIDLVNDEQWIMLLGDDDVLQPNCFEDWYANYEEFQGKTNVVRFASKVISESNYYLSELFTNPKWERGADAFMRKFRGVSRSSLSEYVFKKEPYMRFGFRDYPLAWHSDDMAWLELTEGLPIFSINSSYVKVRVSVQSISGNPRNIEMKKDAYVQFLDDLFKQLGQFNKEDALTLLKHYEMVIKKENGLKIGELIHISKEYLKRGMFSDLVKFHLRSYGCYI